MRVWRRAAALLLCAAALCRPAQAVSVGGGEGTSSGFVALTFDDGPTGELTASLLDGLKVRYVPATFFLCGYRVEQWPDLVRRMADEGHELAVHGQTHAYLHDKSDEVVRGELEAACGLVSDLTGVRPSLFRPPGGLTSETLLEAAGDEGLSVILWSVDPEDWRTRDAGTVVRRVVRCVRDGDIILMHDLAPSSVRAALTIVDTLEARGFQFCTVSELAALRRCPLEPAKLYFDFRPEEQSQVSHFRA